MLEQYRVYRYDHLDSPAMTAGEGAVLIGAQNGLFPDMGYALPGEMGGLWTGDKKVCDGFFVAVDDIPLLTCDAFEAHPVSPAFHYRMIPQQMHVVRRQYVPDGMKGVVVELSVENLRPVTRTVEISFTVRTELLTIAAAQGKDGLELGRDVGEFDERTQAFYARDSRNPWHAVWGTETKHRALAFDTPREIYGFGSTQGKGVNGRAFYRLRLKGHDQGMIRFFIAGGFMSQTKAEDALLAWREKADTLLAEKEARVARRLAESFVTLPYERLVRCWNWYRVYSEWLTCRLPKGGQGLCMDLPEHPVLFGDHWEQAVEGLLPMGGSEQVKDILRTLVNISVSEHLAPGRLARSASGSGSVLRTGSAADSAAFIALVHQTLLWSGDEAFAREMLPQTGLCVSYLRRSTRSFTEVPDELLSQLRRALEGQCYILEMTGGDSAPIREILEKLPEVREPEQIGDNMTAGERAAWHGKRDHVEQMTGCLESIARRSLPGLPGALRSKDADGVLVSAQSGAAFVLPMTRYLFGILPEAGKKRLTFRPHTPIGWSGWKLENLLIGEAHFSLESERVSPSSVRYTVRTDEPGWTLAVCENGEEKQIELNGGISLTMGD